ncbi:MAG: isoprenylcysteine carboxylmethyltransferase family protein [Ignavibacteriae bacterium]|nr:isoprenylcysteine carboxylmethyltransferase family protein [Ignavibacteriota bacterium]
MRQVLEAFGRIALFVLVLFLWSWAIGQELSHIIDTAIIAGGVLLIFPIAWVGRNMLDRNPTTSRAVWVTTIVHYAVVILGGVAIIRAIETHQQWSGWLLPIPTKLGFVLVILTGAASLLSVINLALKGLGAPFAVALSRKLAVDWLYAWTRNPMVLAVLALGVSMGIWFQSLMFLLWVLILFAPALLTYVKVFEERELEIRFGASYLEYKSRTPMLFPRRPRG